MNQFPLSALSQVSNQDSNLSSNKKHFSHDHLSSLLDGFVDFSALEKCDLCFKGLSLNSNKVHEGFLFLACASVGNSLHHGIAYAGEAIKSGASCVLWEPTEELTEMPASCPSDLYGGVQIPVLRVDGLSDKMGEIAARFYQHPSQNLTVIGITGTNGKTSTAHFIAQLLGIINRAASRVRKCAVIGTLGNGFYGQLEQSTHTTPDAVTLQGLLAQYKEQEAETLVMEVSSHALAQGRVNGIEFNCAVLTNLTRDHLDYHKDMQTYGNEKLKLFQMSSLKHIIVNQDDNFSQVIIDSLAQQAGQEKAQLLRYSRTDQSADYFAQNVSLNTEGLSFTLYAQAQAYPVKSHLVGDFNIDNLLAAIAVLQTQGYKLSTIVDSIAQLKTVPGRMEKIVLPSSINKKDEAALIVVDYAHTSDALEKGLKALKMHTQGKLYCVFGCGGDRDKGKRPLMAAVAQQIADQIIVTSDNPRTESEQSIINDILSGFEHRDNVLVEVDRKTAIETTLQSLSSDDVLLIAGKGHEDYQEIKGQRLPFSDKQTVLSFYDSKLLKDGAAL